MLTKKQRELLDFISQFITKNNYSPSYREIMAGVGIKSVSTVAQHVDNLIAKGILRKTNNAMRSLELTEAAEQASLIDQKIAYYEVQNEMDKVEILRRAKELLKS